MSYLEKLIETGALQCSRILLNGKELLVGFKKHTDNYGYYYDFTIEHPLVRGRTIEVKYPSFELDKVAIILQSLMYQNHDLVDTTVDCCGWSVNGYYPKSPTFTEPETDEYDLEMSLSDDPDDE